MYSSGTETVRAMPFRTPLFASGSAMKAAGSETVILSLPEICLADTVPAADAVDVAVVGVAEVGVGAGVGA